MCRSLPATLIVLSLVLAACGNDPPAAPAAPDPGAPSDLSSQAFRVTLDIPTGRATVAPPASATAPASGGLAPSFSIIGAEGLELFAGAMTCVPIPKNREEKRCSLDMGLRNRFRETDLVTPTSFPKLPEGVSGVLMFPWTATATGGTGPVTPSPDWDYGPINFFNDFGACSLGGKSDCVRYELIPSPFYAQSGSDSRRVGFDVPVGATQVTAYVLVAADLRENPFRTFEARPIAELCGEATSVGGTTHPSIRILLGRYSDEVVSRGFCSFENPLSPQVWRIHFARLKIRHVFGTGDPGAEYLDYGETLDGEDFALATTHEWKEMFFQPDPRQFQGVYTSEVKAAYEAGASRFSFRFRAKNEGDTQFYFEGTYIGNEFKPLLELTYSLK